MNVASMKLKPFPATVRLKVTDSLEKGLEGKTEKEEGVITITLRPGRGMLWAAVHEAVHAVQFLEDWVGGRFDPETEAYTAAWIAEWCWKNRKKAV